MKEGTSAVHASIVREFMHIIAAQAKAALAGIENPGVLQLSRLHPASEDLVPSRFMLDDIEHLIRAAVDDSANGHNSYVEARSVRRDLRGNARGKLTDTVGVFALVVDSDADKGMGWTPTPTTRPSMTVETSPGNFQFWFFLREAIGPELAQKLGERIRRAVNSDHDTGNPVQPYRVAGTINYPNANKIARGRVTVPTRLVEFDLEVLWTPEEIEQAFPPKTDDTEPAPGADEANVPTEVMDAIRSTEKGGRGQVLWNVVRTLKEDGWSNSTIVGLLEKYPNGLAQKFRGRLQREVERVYGKIKTGAAPTPGAKRPVRMISLQELKAMTFEPLKYVVPDIFVEGLTLFAGKPKIGKSWLVLHAALAIARGGFTLGELHCIQGDVLYLALEDSERRLKSRIHKLCSPTDWPEGLTVCCQQDFPRLGDGGGDVIRDWIKSHPRARMVAIDALAMVRPLKQGDETNYQADYLALVEARQLANECGIALIVVHHLRKAESDDPFDTISGTLGLTGAVDNVVVLKRDGFGGFVLYGKGRDLAEIEKAMTFDRGSCLWRVEGDAAPIRRSSERTKILEAIAEAAEPINPTDIAAATKMKSTNVRFLLGKLVKEGAVEKVERGRYCLPGTKPAPKKTPKPTKKAPKAAHYRVIGSCADDAVCVQCGQPGGVKRIRAAGWSDENAEPLHEACATARFAAL
jgi:hypothetical protein